MKTMKQTWQRSLTAFALLTSLPGENHAAQTVNATRVAKAIDVAMVAQENPFAVTQNQSVETQKAPAPAAEKPSNPTGNTSGQDPAPGSMPYYQRAMMERYGLIHPGAPPTAGKPATAKEPGPIASRLEKVVLDEVMFDGVSLPEVLRFLDEESRKRDPDKQGINFLINPNAPGVPAAQAVDPTTGQPIPLPPPEPLDMNGVIVRFNLPLRNMRLKDVLDAIVKVANKPIEYSVEDYGVVFSPGPNPSVGPVPAPLQKPLEAAPLQVRTFKVNTNTFLAGLKRAFGTGSEPRENATPDQVRFVLRDVFTRLGIDMDVPGKTVFYNDLTGIVMVRATVDDLEIVKAAIETLGGSAGDSTLSQNSNADGSPTSQMNEFMMRRYGISPAKK